MIKDRFATIRGLIDNGIIKILSRNHNNVVLIQLPYTLWMQVTIEDLYRGAQGKLTQDIGYEVHSVIRNADGRDITVELHL